MPTKNPIIPILAQAISGTHAHVLPKVALEALGLEIAGHQPTQKSHSIWQIISHLNYWWTICFGMVLDQPRPSAKSAAFGWPSQIAPPDQTLLNAACQTLVENTDKGIQLLSSHSEKLANFESEHGNGFQLLQTFASHQSYHLGQIVLLRQLQEDWPPPSGGETW